MTRNEIYGPATAANRESLAVTPAPPPAIINRTLTVAEKAIIERTMLRQMPTLGNALNEEACL